MNRRTLAICDSEQAYACRLMDALSRREDFPFEVLAFTGAERLQDSLARKPVQILLIAQGLFREEMKDWVRHVILLQEEENSPVQELPCVSKYSSVLRIAKKSRRRRCKQKNCHFADGREGLRVRILYAGRTQPADNACADDGTASGGK